MLNIKLPVVETERLILRELMIEDAADMFEYASDQENCEFLQFPLHENINNTKEVITNIFLQRPNQGIPIGYAITLKNDGKMIGVIDFHSIRYGDVGEIGYVINKKYWNQGYVTEACKKIIEVGFNSVGLRIIQISHHVDNIGSRKVIEKCGFIYEGTNRKYLSGPTGEYGDHPFYSILKEEYLND